MATHRKPRSSMIRSAPARRGAVGATAAALASVTLLTQSASAEPGTDRPGLEETQKKVDELYRQAGAATQRYNAAQEETERQRRTAERALDRVADRTADLNDARRTLGTFAAAQYRNGGMSETATLLLTADPQGYFQQSHVRARLTEQQNRAVGSFQKQQRTAAAERGKAAKNLADLTRKQRELAREKRAVQSKLTEARTLLSQLTAEERARLAAVERRKQEEARRKAAEAERRAEAARERAAQQREQSEAAAPSPGSGNTSDAGASDAGGQQSSPSAPATPSAPTTGTGGTGTGSSTSTRAQKVLAFAKGELGKPYVWGAAGPNSYDCSGFTQAAWRAAGVGLPRTTYDQVKVGQKVSRANLQPGDLVFFYADITHVGIYAGGGQMIHASKPGDDVKYESVDYMPFHSAVRPG